MSDDIQKETERIHQGIFEILSLPMAVQAFSEALAKRDAEIDRLRGLLREIGDIGWLQAPHPLTKRVREALGE